MIIGVSSGRKCGKLSPLITGGWKMCLMSVPAGAAAKLLQGRTSSEENMSGSRANLEGKEKTHTFHNFQV